jgi:hypothetical protein
MKMEELQQHGASAYFVILCYFGRICEKNSIVLSVGMLSKKCVKMTMFVSVPDQYIRECYFANGAESRYVRADPTTVLPSVALLDICNRYLVGMKPNGRN